MNSPQPLLLDSHVLLWWWCCPLLLTPHVRNALADPQQPVLVSAASLQELSAAARNGDLPELRPVLWQLPQLVEQEGFRLLPISASHALLAGQLSGPGDDIDRLLLAQAQLENLRLVSADPALHRPGSAWLW